MPRPPASRSSTFFLPPLALFGVLLSSLAALSLSCESVSCDGDPGCGDKGGGGGQAGATPGGGNGGVAGSGSGAGGSAPVAGTGGVAGDAGVGAAGTSGGGTGSSQGGAGGSDDAGAGGDDAGAGGEAGGSNDAWAGCPSEEDYPGEAGWPHRVEVTEEAVYCATFSEHRTLKEELAQKALLRFAPGSYPLPAENRSDLGLPLCLKTSRDGAPVPVGAGQSTYSQSSLGQTLSSYAFVQPLTAAPLGFIEWRIQNTHASSEAPGFLLDGTESDMDAEFYRDFTWCEQSGEACDFPGRFFDSCTHDSSRLNRHDVVLDTGGILLELRIGESFASTEPGAFVRASGTFRGQSFDQHDYFRLVYRPSHHHFERDFAVLFDAPIDGVCGVEITGIEPVDTSVSDEAYAVDCALNRLETLTVVSHEFSVEPRP